MKEKTVHLSNLEIKIYLIDLCGFRLIKTLYQKEIQTKNMFDS